MPNLNNLTTQDLQWGTANWSGQGYIDGLQMQWVSANAVTVTSGAAYIPSLNKCLPVPNAIALTGLALAANTKYFAYLYLNAGVPDVELSTTAPSAPYNGTARTKTGDTSRRYLRMLVTDGSGNIYAFKQTRDLIQYMANIYSTPFLVLNGGVATAPTDVSLASLVPPTSQSALLTCINQDTAVAVVLGTSDQGYTLAASAFQAFVNNANSVLGFFNLNSSQVLQYMYRGTPTGSFGIRVSGYLEER